MTVRGGIAQEPAARAGWGFDKLGVLIAGLSAYALLFAPLMTFRVNRIVPGEGRMLWDSLPAQAGLLFAVIVLAAAVTLRIVVPPPLEVSTPVTSMPASR